MPNSTNQYVGIPSSKGGGRGGAAAASIRSSGSGRSSYTGATLSARSNASVVSMHANSYSYLSDRVYDFVHAKSAWMERVQSELEGQESKTVALKRLPADFDPFFAIDVQNHLDTQLELDGGSDQAKDESVGLLFQTVYAIFSSRAWDRLYLALGLLWAVLCPSYLDGVMVAVERRHMEWVLLAMCGLAITPPMTAVFLKAFFSSKFRTCVRESKQSAGVFFILATKSIPVPQLCFPRLFCGKRVCGKKVYPDDDRPQETDSHDVEAPKGGTDVGVSDQHVVSKADHSNGQSGLNEQNYRETTSLGDVTGGKKMRVTVAPAMVGRDGRGRVTTDRGRSRELELPPRHWRCIVCKKVNALPDSWDGRAGKALHVVIKHKLVDAKAMYGVFKTTPAVPRCHKCRTPFNYSFRNGHGVEPRDNNDSRSHNVGNIAAQRNADNKAPAQSERALMASADAISVSYTSTAGDLSSTPFSSMRRRVKRWIRRLKQRDLGIGGGRDGNEEQQRELWYGREFHRELKTFFKPELPRPVLPPQDGRYAIGERVACFAGKEAWYPGTIEASRENNTYDVRYNNGDIAQHVFPYMVRFPPIHNRDSRLVCLFYGLMLAAAVMWPIVGFFYWSSDDETLSSRGPAVAAPALVFGVVGAVAVAVQFWEIYSRNRSAGFCVTARYASAIAATPASLAFVGGTALVKASNASISGSWIEMLLLPAMLFTLTGGGYAHAVSPAYGKAWAAASLPWLIFLLLVALRLDGEAGDASPVFGRMTWLAVFFPLWVLVCMIFAAHHVLPLVWDVQGFPEPANIPVWLTSLSYKVREAGGVMISAIRKAAKRVSKNDSSGDKDVAFSAEDEEDGHEEAGGVKAEG